MTKVKNPLSGSVLSTEGLSSLFGYLLNDFN